VREGIGGPQDEDRLYAADDLGALAKRAGLDVYVAKTVERPLPDGVALDAVLRARRPPPP
jgi:hypothetical protein